MATIVKRKKRYSVVYVYTDENGEKRQKWETFTTNAEAKKRKMQIEFEQTAGRFILPNANTISDLLEEYMSIYGVNTWAMSTYEARRSLIFNYIQPLIGDMKLGDITPRTMDKFYQSLLRVKSKVVNNRKPSNEYMTPHTIREIHKLLRNAFNQAVKWELMARNPVLNATLPKEEHQQREIWTVETLFKALEVCDDDNLALALNLAFSCSLRMGEMLGLTWDCVDISEKSIKNGSAHIFINKELQRVNRNALEQLGEKGVMLRFPPALASIHTVLVLKEPKTKTSVRKVFLPKTVAEMLVKRLENIKNLKELFGEEYTDYNLVFATSCGRPIEGQIINRALSKLIREHDLPPVVFHSLRHSIITYKLKLNGGDMKSVQGDSGHAQVKMVADVYSHIIDDDRRINAQRFEEQFYHTQTTPQIDEKQEEIQPTEPEVDQEMVLKLLAKPEMATLLKSLAKSL
ncbi:tyrosine-type recombinase/integrase [Murimonas intestini]|uniref:tyrosine-type recombinase/integrase n=1 Tax=Murimonas intestini TaxID=1337051 RepID=UPI0011DE2CD4|nr:site-specific integrase [Murimonas intestini]